MNFGVSYFEDISELGKILYRRLDYTLLVVSWIRVKYKGFTKKKIGFK